MRQNKVVVIESRDAHALAQLAHLHLELGRADQGAELKNHMGLVCQSM